MMKLWGVSLAVGLMATMGAAMAGQPAPDPVRDFGKKRVALSFDDAPRGDGPVLAGSDRTSKLLSALERAETGPVVFYVTTRGLGQKDGRARVEKYAEAGHLIANHSHTHQWAHKTDPDVYLKDIDEAERSLEGFDNRRAWFRFPFLDEGRDKQKREELLAGLKARDLEHGYVTIDTYDWHVDSMWRKALASGLHVDVEALGRVYVDLIVEAAEFYDEKAVEIFEQRPAQVLLLHENDVNAFFIEDVVEALRAKGWEIIDPDTAYADPIAKTVPKTTFSGQGRLAGLAVDAGVSAYDFDHPTADEVAINERLDEAGIFTD